MFGKEPDSFVTQERCCLHSRASHALLFSRFASTSVSSILSPLSLFFSPAQYSLSTIFSFPFLFSSLQHSSLKSILSPFLSLLFPLITSLLSYIVSSISYLISPISSTPVPALLSPIFFLLRSPAQQSSMSSVLSTLSSLLSHYSLLPFLLSSIFNLWHTSTFPPLSHLLYPLSSTAVSSLNSLILCNLQQSTPALQHSSLLAPLSHSPPFAAIKPRPRPPFSSTSVSFTPSPAHPLPLTYFLCGIFPLILTLRVLDGIYTSSLCLTLPCGAFPFVRAWPNLHGRTLMCWRCPNAPSGVAAFMLAHSKTPYIIPSMVLSCGKGVVSGRRGEGQQPEFALRFSLNLPMYANFCLGTLAHRVTLLKFGFPEKRQLHIQRRQTLLKPFCSRSVKSPAIAVCHPYMCACSAGPHRPRICHSYM